MAAPNSSNFKTNVGRRVTKKWREANQISYDGDDWGDDDEYEEPLHVPMENPRYPTWGPESNAHPSNRSVTNPSPSRMGGRLSFDQGDERKMHDSAPADIYRIKARAPRTGGRSPSCSLPCQSDDSGGLISFHLPRYKQDWRSHIGRDSSSVARPNRCISKHWQYTARPCLSILQLLIRFGAASVIDRAISLQSKSTLDNISAITCTGI